MKKMYLLAIILFTTISLILFVFYNQYSTYYEDEKINSYISRNIDILNENLSFEKRYALSLSLFISKNQVIKDALKTNNHRLSLEAIDTFLKEIKKSANIENVDIQIHTKDLRAFARNWDKSDYVGTKLNTFRKGLVIVQDTKESFVSIELGKRLNIKAISPILDDKKEFLGSIEIIMNFKNIEQRLKKFDLELAILLDENFIDIAVDLKDHEKIGEYYVADTNSSSNVYRELLTHINILSDNKFYYLIGDRIMVLIPMKSVGIEDVGVIVLSMNAKHNEAYSVPEGNLELEDNEYTFNNSKRKVIIR